MEELWQFPCCWAAIDGCHIPIKCPPGGLECCKEFHNVKNIYSIVLMAIDDSKYRFVWGSCGFPGIPMMPLFSNPRTYGKHFKMDCCSILLNLSVKSVYPHFCTFATQHLCSDNINALTGQKERHFKGSIELMGSR